MDLKELLNQTTIQHNHQSTNESTSEPVSESTDEVIEDSLESEPEPEPESEPEPDIDHRFKQPWNKLEKGMKMNRILLYVDSQKQENSLSDNQTRDLKNILFRGCETGMFNKLSDVKYDSETGLIESFKQLEFNESSKKYKLKTSGTKNRSVSKSRSNIDRIMKKK
jgi:hypothetical protein